MEFRDGDEVKVVKMDGETDSLDVNAFIGHIGVVTHIYEESEDCKYPINVVFNCEKYGVRSECFKSDELVLVDKLIIDTGTSTWDGYC